MTGMDSNAPVAVRLAQIAKSIAFATWAGTTVQRLLAFSPHLTAVREDGQALGEVARAIAAVVDEGGTSAPL